MRVNKFIASSLGVSRRQADDMVRAGRITVNGQLARVGQTIEPGSVVEFDGKSLTLAQKIYLLINKPKGYVSSRRGQGSKTIYSLLPDKFSTLKTVGRLDKDSSGVILMTNDGDFANQMTHPKYKKLKVYEVDLDKQLSEQHQSQIKHGVILKDGLSRLKLLDGGERQWKLAMSEGRNRQIRRTFLALGYKVVRLHRTQFGPYGVEGLKSGGYKQVEKR